MIRYLSFAFVLVLVLAAVKPIDAQTRRQAPSAASDSSDNLKMRETGIQGEHQRPDVLFVIPTGRGGPIVSSRLRDYSYDIQEPVVKMWLEGELRIAHQVARREGQAPDWREAVAAAAKAPAAQRPIPMPQMQTLPRAAEPEAPRDTYQSGPRVTAPGIPREAMQLPRR